MLKDQNIKDIREYEPISPFEFTQPFSPETVVYYGALAATIFSVLVCTYTIFVW